MSGTDLQALEQPCPSQKLLVIVQYGEMSQQQFHLIGSKKITARDLEMTNVLCGQCTAHGISVAVGIDDHSHRLLGMGMPQLFDKMGYVVELTVHIITGNNGKTPICLVVAVNLSAARAPDRYAVRSRHSD